METQGATLKCFLILDVQRDCYEMTGSRVKCAALAGHFLNLFFSSSCPAIDHDSCWFYLIVSINHKGNETMVCLLWILEISGFDAISRTYSDGLVQYSISCFTVCCIQRQQPDLWNLWKMHKEWLKWGKKDFFFKKTKNKTVTYFLDRLVHKK